MESEAKLIKREFLLEGLDCANCAMKVERGVKKIPGVMACTVNFMTKTLALETEQEELERVLQQTLQTVQKLEPDVTVTPKTKSGGRLTGGAGGVNSGRFRQIEQQEQSGQLGQLGQLEQLEQLEQSGQLEQFGRPGQLEQSPRGAAELSAAVREVREQEAAGEPPVKKGWRHPLAIRLIVSGLLTGAGILLPVSGWGELVLFAVAYVVAGGDIVLKALKNIARGRVFDENFLMSVATLGAFAIRQFPEGIAVMLFYQLGEWFQGIAVNRSRNSIASLMNIRPDFANLKAGDKVIRVSPEDVNIGDVIIVKPGEKVPLDGVITEGSSFVDTSALTGESVPREVGPGSDVLAGVINTQGLITLKVTKLFAESSVAKILELVENASSHKAPTENFITKFARYYTPFVVIVAVLLAIVPPLAISDATFSDWVYRALVFLVISCPCALVVSIPLSFFGGIGSASKSGILIKGSNYLEALNAVKYVVFDKTGTLTKGSFTVTGIHPADGFAREELLEYAAKAELHSNHPIAESIRAAYAGEPDDRELEDYRELSGFGVQVVINGKKVSAGNAKLMDKERIPFAAVEDTGTLVHVAVEGKYAGCIVISDEIKSDAAKAIQTLKQLGVKKTVMLTGDAKAVGEAVGRKLKLDEVYSELLPEEKVAQIERLDRQKSGKEKIIFVGDGINDTPVLARADVGVAMGGLGSDAAIEAADIVIMNDEPSKISTAITIAKRTRRIVWENIIFALGVKAVFLLLGAFGIATMWEAVFSDVGVTVIAVINAMRVLRAKA